MPANMRRHTCVGGCTIYRNLVLCQSDISCVQNSEQQMRKNKCQWWKVSQNTGVIPIANSRSALRKQMHAYHLTISKKTKKLNQHLRVAATNHAKFAARGPKSTGTV